MEGRGVIWISSLHILRLSLHPPSGILSIVFFLFVLICPIKAAQADDSIQEMCEAHSNLAKSIMRSRQYGLEMSQMMRIADKTDDSKISKLSKFFVVKAFKYPRVYDKEIESDVVSEFASDAYFQCFLALEKLAP
jgi:hypothetical protein